MSGPRSEFDPRKSQSNKIKHGISFTEAQFLWSDNQRIQISARTNDEPRFVVVGIIEDKHWSVVITYRSERIRIISVSCSRKEEVKLYEG
ncbi:BrnT family toxin [Synechocystis sp. PCC 7339]|uniref:BrnT family toxin n=1 Tax=unclassified Synechocystis TaxID=2640012 RepID=UPI001BAE664B|nr:MULTISPECIES: BrnT family toxin [unclassified Synechocystis]QUS60513.1 BrnT family toxin [Synechocystis sp. PCC 7338]UAJ72035.1 BrnT family toxin [Synechocystis sp. PCC 7339]